MKISNGQIVFTIEDKHFFKGLNKMLRDKLPSEMDKPNILMLESEIKELVEQALKRYSNYYCPFVSTLRRLIHSNNEQLKTYGKSPGVTIYWTASVYHHSNPDYLVPLALLSNIKVYDGYVTGVWNWCEEDATVIVASYLVKEREQAERIGKEISDFETWLKEVKKNE